MMIKYYDQPRSRDDDIPSFPQSDKYVKLVDNNHCARQMTSFIGSTTYESLAEKEQLFIRAISEDKIETKILSFDQI